MPQIIIPKRDLVVLTACKNSRFAVEGILSRPQRLHVRPIDADFLTHPDRDSGCLNTAHEVLRPSLRDHEHAIVIFDREGCGRDGQSPADLEAQVRDRLSGSGWGERAEVIVLDPELEIWVWSDSPHVARVLGWRQHNPTLREWLIEKGYLEVDAVKPRRPKEATEAALEIARVPRSSSLFRELAQNVSFERCTDAAFCRLRDILYRWFHA